MSSTPTSSTAVRIPGAALWSRAPDLIEGAIRSMVALFAADFEAIFFRYPKWCEGNQNCRSGGPLCR